MAHLSASSQLRDDALEVFAAHGATPPPPDRQGYVQNGTASIWYAVYGTGSPVVLLHGGLGHSGNWAGQISPLAASGRQVILIDARGHGRSTIGEEDLHFDLMARDVLVVMDRLEIETADVCGWSDGACIALILAMQAANRISSVFFFACNVDATGTAPFSMTDVVRRCFTRHRLDYSILSPTPADFDRLLGSVEKLQASEPNISSDDLKVIVPTIAIVQAEHDEFIREDHARYLARTIPAARFIRLPGVSHFAPLQDPQLFNSALTDFLAGVSPILRDGRP